METNKKAGKSLQYYMRAVHRVLGYLTIGLVVVYSLSGIILIHRSGDMMRKTTKVELTLQPNLSADDLGKELKLKRMIVTREDEQCVEFNDGRYDKVSGSVSYTKRDYPFPMNKFVALHKLSDGQNHGVAIATSIFGFILFLLALTSLFMFKVSAKQFRSNMAYTAAGVVIALVLLLLL